MSDFLNIKRSSFEAIQYLLSHFPCVAVIGARQVGKTTLLKQLLPDAAFFDLENDHDASRIQADPLYFLTEVSYPAIFDEAQLLPELFKALRVKIDENRNQNGQFLISGSSSPQLLSNINESLAGRVAIFELGTLTWNEAWDYPRSKFSDGLMRADLTIMQSLERNTTMDQLNTSLLRGGYPEPFLFRQDAKRFDIWMDNYISTYINRDIRQLFPGLNIETYKRFIRMLCFSSGDIINYSNYARSLDVSQPTVKHYFDIAQGTFLWRRLPGYEHSETKRLTKMPKGHIRDAGLICHLLKLNDSETLRAHPQYGRIWEAFVIEHLLKNLNETLFTYDSFYYRTKNHVEIDLIIEGKMGIIPIEIKSGATLHTRTISTLKRFIEDYQSPFGVLINQGDSVTMISERIIQVPVGWL